MDASDGSACCGSPCVRSPCGVITGLSPVSAAPRPALLGDANGCVGTVLAALAWPTSPMVEGFAAPLAPPPSVVKFAPVAAMRVVNASRKLRELAAASCISSCTAIDDESEHKSARVMYPLNQHTWYASMSRIHCTRKLSSSDNAGSVPAAALALPPGVRCTAEVRNSSNDVAGATSPDPAPPNPALPRAAPPRVPVCLRPLLACPPRPPPPPPLATGASSVNGSVGNTT